jgi:RNA processing factor Prp31
MEDIIARANNLPDYVGREQASFEASRQDIFRDLQGDKMGSLKEIIDDILELISLREQLNKDIFEEIDKIRILINNFISELSDPNNRAEQLRMRQKQIDIEELRVQEKLNCWRDIAELKRELRERIKEFKERETRASALDRIFEE